MKVPGLLVWGPRIRSIFDDYLDTNPDTETLIWDSLCKKESLITPSHTSVIEMRNRVLHFVMDALKDRGDPHELKGPPEDCLLAVSYTHLTLPTILLV